MRKFTRTIIDGIIYAAPLWIPFSLYITPAILYALDWNILAHFFYSVPILLTIGVCVFSIVMFVKSFIDQNVTLRSRCYANLISTLPAAILGTLICMWTQTL